MLVKVDLDRSRAASKGCGLVVEKKSMVSEGTSKVEVVMGTAELKKSNEGVGVVESGAGEAEKKSTVGCS